MDDSVRRYLLSRFFDWTRFFATRDIEELEGILAVLRLFRVDRTALSLEGQRLEDLWQADKDSCEAAYQILRSLASDLLDCFGVPDDCINLETRDEEIEGFYNDATIEWPIETDRAEVEKPLDPEGAEKADSP